MLLRRSILGGIHPAPSLSHFVWRRSTVKTGGTLRTAIDVDFCRGEAGWLRTRSRDLQRFDGQVYRIAFGAVSTDRRVDLRGLEPAADEMQAIRDTCSVGNAVASRQRYPTIGPIWRRQWVGTVSDERGRPQAVLPRHSEDHREVEECSTPLDGGIDVHRTVCSAIASPPFTSFHVLSRPFTSFSTSFFTSYFTSLFTSFFTSFFTLFLTPLSRPSSRRSSEEAKRAARFGRSFSLIIRLQPLTR